MPQRPKPPTASVWPSSMRSASAGRVCVAEAEQIVKIGELDPDHVHTPSIFVQRLVHNPHPEKRIEQRTLRPQGAH